MVVVVETPNFTTSTTTVRLLHYGISIDWEYSQGIRQKKRERARDTVEKEKQNRKKDIMAGVFLLL